MKTSKDTDAKFEDELIEFFETELSRKIDPAVARTIIIHRMESFSLAYDAYRKKPNELSASTLKQIADQATELLKRLIDQDPN